MTGLRLRPITIAALLGLIALLSAPAMAYNLSESRVPSLEDAQNINEYGSIVHDPISRYIYPVDPSVVGKPTYDSEVDLPDHLRFLKPPLLLEANPKDTSTFSGDTPRVGTGVPFPSSSGGATTEPVNRSAMRSTLEDVNEALGLK